MGQVNGRREGRTLESDSEPSAQVQGAQASAKNGRIPGLFRADQQTERLSAQAVLAEGEEPGSNTLNMIFQEVRITFHLVNLRRNRGFFKVPAGWRYAA